MKSEWLFAGTVRRSSGMVNARQLSDTRLLANVRDVSARRNMEDELRASKRFIEAVAKASPPVIYVFNLDQGRMTYANRKILRDLKYPEPARSVEIASKT